MANYSGPPHKKRRYGDHSSSSSYDDSFGIQSLPVASLPDDFSGDPIDGEQYLAIVRREASAAPGVFFAEHNPYAAPSILLEETTFDPTISLPPPLDDAKIPTKEETLLMPSLEWRTAFELQFRNAKEALSNPPIEQVKLTKDDLPKIGNHNAWYAWIHGRPPPSPLGEAASTKTHEWRTRILHPHCCYGLTLNRSWVYSKHFLTGSHTAFPSPTVKPASRQQRVGVEETKSSNPYTHAGSSPCFSNSMVAWLAKRSVR